MKKNCLVLFSLIAVMLCFNKAIEADKKLFSSRIVSVKLYQNQAKIVRKTVIHLKKGSNNIVLSNLPPLLYDWSVKGSLPKNFNGKIISLEVEKKALVKKRQKRILKIEDKLEALREKDQIFVDDLKNIRSQEKFLNSILEFTNQNVSKELATRIPQIRVWDNTLNYVSKKKSELLKKKRRIEKAREQIGKEIQRWEFELSQIAGYTYFRNYQSLNKVILHNRANMAIQQFADISGQYAERNRLLKKPTEKVDFEKRLILNIYSSKTADIKFSFSYVIPNTYWQMKYDIRASSVKKNIKMVIYGNIYQKTEENWKNIYLSLSTGMPVSAIIPPRLAPWYLDIYSPGRIEKKRTYGKKFKAGKRDYGKQLLKDKIKKEEKEDDYESRVKEKGPYFEISLPIKQTILSSNKYQKKFIKDYTLKGKKGVNFYYEVTPSMVRNSYLKVETTNTTRLPWLSGEAQIFLDNEFMGKVTIPFTPPGKKENIVLGIETRITSKKELVKKYEDTAGVFGGMRRILYKYKITVENQFPQKKEVIVYDSIPVSRNKKIKVKIENLSLPFLIDKKFKKSTQYAQGIRKWKLTMGSHRKKEITYDLVISFDKKIRVNGVR